MLSLLFALNAYASAPICLDGFYDLGKRAAALGFACNEGDNAQIVFCKRSTLLEEGTCTGARSPIPCRWENEAWKCEETGYYHFEAVIRKISETKISYQFRSNFNEGELTGEKILSKP